MLLPDDALARQAIVSSQALRRPDSVFTLEDGKYYPHLSLYMLRLKLGDIPAVAESLRQIASTQKSFMLRATHYDQERSYVVVDYQVLTELDALQQVVVGAINLLRDGIMEKDRERTLEATGVAKQNYDTYGYKYIGELFKPHITLTRFENEEPADESKLPKASVFDGRFVKIGLYELGVSNTCVRKLAEFPLLSA